MKKIILLVDSNALIHRAYHAYPPTLTLKDGTPTNAVYGFTQLLLTAVEKLKPETVICTFDTGKPTFRHLDFVDYKAHRTPLDNDLKVQFPLVREVVEAFDIPIYSIDGFEADDLIGTLSVKELDDHDIVILTGDSDQYQLVNERVSIFMAARSFKDSKLMNLQDVITKLGFEPKYLADYKGLRGDTSDNIPGIKGIGEKTATELVAKYGDIENIYKHIDEIPSKAVREKLVSGFEIAMMSKKLATIDCSAPVSNFDISSVRFLDFDASKVNQCLSKFEFRSLRDRFAKLKVAGDLKVSEIPNDGLFNEEKTKNTRTAPTGGARTKITIGSPRGIPVTPVFEIDGVWVGWNIKDYVKSNLEFEKIFEGKYFDLVIAEFLLDMGNKTGSRDGFHLQDFVSQGDDKDRAYIEEYYNKFKIEFEQFPTLYKLFNEVEMPVMKILYYMEKNGVECSAQNLEEIGITLNLKIDEVQKSIFHLVGHEFNVGSPKQVGQVLSEELNIPLKKNKLGNFQTGEEVLSKFSAAFPVVHDILKYREYSKLNSTYVEGLKKFIQEDGRIHTSYSQTIASTGRLSSKDPNLQNIPKGSELADLLKSSFVAKDGFELVSLDYSQQELRILAHLSGEKNLIDAYNQGLDIHRQTASKIFGIEYDTVTKEQRNIAKTVNFGLVYGQGPFGLSEQLGIPVKECQEFISKFFENFPMIKTYFDQLLVKGLEIGYIETIMGRRRSTAILKSPNSMLKNMGKRELINFPIQGSAADLTKWAMISLYKAGYTNREDCRLLLQVHDELVFEVRDDTNIEKTAVEIQKIMEDSFKLKVPVLVDWRKSKRWG